jgi:putative NADH-flavin reductase
MSRISVLGGTGYTGNAIVREAVRRGHQVTSVSRSEPTDRVEGVDYLIGSALVADVLAAAVADHDVVIEAVSPRGDMAGKVEGLVDQLIELAPRTGARLGVIGGVSSLYVEDGGPRLFDVNEVPAEVLPEIQTGLTLLQTLKETPEGVDWFYLSPPLDYGAWVPAKETGRYRLSDDVLLRDEDGGSSISAADLALAVLDEIERPRYRRRRFHVAH